jgi:hypothetical protein
MSAAREQFDAVVPPHATPGDAAAQRREKFNDGALRRLAVCGKHYFKSHGEYVPELARLALDLAAQLSSLEARIQELTSEAASAAREEAPRRALAK